MRKRMSTTATDTTGGHVCNGLSMLAGKHGRRPSKACENLVAQNGSASIVAARADSFVATVTKGVTHPSRDAAAIGPVLSASGLGPHWGKAPRLSGAAASVPARSPWFPCVVLAMPEAAYPTASLLQGLALARRLGANLHVLRVLPERTKATALLLERSSARTRQIADRVIEAHRTTRQWLSDCLLQGDTVEHLAIVCGDFVEQASRYALDIRAKLILVPPCEVGLGRRVTSLACTSGAPVLVARAVATKATILAATDLDSSHFPVLSTSAELGWRLDAPLVVVHNVSPLSAVMGVGTNWPGVLLPADPARAARVERLMVACGRLPVEAQAVVRDEVSVVDAILDEGRLQDADLIVVGVRQRNWFEGLLSGRVAARVATSAERSVLVTPIDESSSPTSVLVDWSLESGVFAGTGGFRRARS
ncbi:MAG: universal stress protein [Deltaproteobacteria bacterium]